MDIITSPERIPPSGVFPLIFLAGGITGCPDWQKRMPDLIYCPETLNPVYLNPRRDVFPMDEPSEAEKQITWECRALHRADAVLFWFPYNTLCPIALFELGVFCASSIPIFVGCHPLYKRKQDVTIQLGLRRPEVPVYFDLEELGKEVSRWLNRQN